ncbi:SDR family NAD(P)-dependent oxidoreductase [Aquabacterium sp.]|uniref:SDR family NAD(P)-dependent oxidoreductase n=1 Tax=Aquabacterium sp. TaxID=1872578 RepID=UPI002C9CB649|nr:SDR family NAD(P)-dependent oxidoreductase [Aquabacterium sp.]HSW08253.1 SDR family NAD(P)-dependent oxidoreductase [Aquabacterium sp.]
MAQHLFIVTGSSRGVGAALVEQLLQPGHIVLGIARHANATLQARADAAGWRLEQWESDLGDPLPVADTLRRWLAAFDPALLGSASLINNAGAIGGGAPLGRIPLPVLSNALRVGLEAALLLCAAFLDVTADWPGQRRVMNISSGLGRRAMAGSAAYCAAKAGMDHLSRVLALEQATLPNPARVVAMAPGVIDTDMQSELRAMDPVAFPDRERFVQLKAAGQLLSPQACAEQLLKRLHAPDFGTDAVADLRT